jgi:hypothetical protein
MTPQSQAGDVGGTTGREAGASRDQRADPGVSPLARGTMPLQQVEIAAPTTARNTRADIEEQADFVADHTGSARGSESAVAVAPAAMPPADTSFAAGISPGRAAYVRAWMKALSQAR